MSVSKVIPFANLTPPNGRIYEMEFVVSDPLIASVESIAGDHGSFEPAMRVNATGEVGTCTITVKVNQSKMTPPPEPVEFFVDAFFLAGSFELSITELLVPVNGNGTDIVITP